MRSLIVILDRHQVAAKEVWRAPGFRRTLEPIAIDRVVFETWRAHRSSRVQQAVVELPIAAGGAPENLAEPQPIQGRQKVYPGVFDVAFTASGDVEVNLRSEQCANQLGNPPRRTRKIGLLRPWRPLR